MRTTSLIIGGLAALLAGCSFIQAVPGAEKVRLETPAGVAGCEALGSTNSIVLDQILGIGRSARAIDSDLFRISANAAAELGGNAIVPVGTPQAGKQKFDIYRCK